MSCHVIASAAPLIRLASVFLREHFNAIGAVFGGRLDHMAATLKVVERLLRVRASERHAGIALRVL